MSWVYQKKSPMTEVATGDIVLVLQNFYNMECSPITGLPVPHGMRKNNK